MLDPIIFDQLPSAVATILDDLAERIRDLNEEWESPFNYFERNH